MEKCLISAPNIKRFCCRDVLTEEGVKFKVKDIWKGRAANVREEGERKRSKKR